MSDHFKGWQDGHLPPPDIPKQEPAEQIKESGEQVLDISGISDNKYLKRSGTDIIGADVTAIKESGGQVLDIGAIADGELLVRDGTDIVGWNGIIPSVRVYNSANISIPNSTNTVLTFNKEHWDTDKMHSTVSNTGRLTCRTAGIYTIFTNIVFDNNASGERVVNFRLNGSTMIASDRRPGHGWVNMLLSTEYKLNANDYLEVIVYQNRGGSLNVIRSNDYSPVFGMTRIGA